MAALMSRQHDEAAAPTCFAMPEARSPVPPATSSARWPGRSPSATSVKCFQTPMHAARHQVVHQIVVAGDRFEDGADARGLLGDGHFLVAEVGRVGALG